MHKQTQKQRRKRAKKGTNVQKILTNVQTNKRRKNIARSKRRKTQ